ncbi:hypothetical protein MNEG_2314 [Monoraphidium neglectum]|jgi:hypothetical protein|uniref:Uncharacterized protein n=1 Tax=Monoraphidium neglectum TaxID=145388 RepID=A0A0D2MT05_9CHLO|nr:hypothetical protein MNEG_2314 [Monoraphidium neglectum]KIZ05645.1 hypothetical protein MNEG_2314 [Monoraphidium neglectum]|eukprot:XP_013904664.1 hypothetical protein MNEG_2314 [Monoraphidium neglectum]
MQVPDKAARLEQLRAAVNEAGSKLSPDAQRACVEQAVEQFHRNNAVVSEFELPLSRTLAALGRAAASLRAPLLALLLAAVAAWVALRWQPRAGSAAAA